MFSGFHGALVKIAISFLILITSSSSKMFFKYLFCCFLKEFLKIFLL